MKKTEFDRFCFIYGHYFHHKFWTVELLPNIALCIDNQMDETFETEDTIWLGFTEYELVIGWFGFYVSFSISIKK